MADNPQTHDIAAVRKLLLAAFTPEELRRFCQDRPTFKPVMTKFGPGMGLDDMIDRVIDCCETHGLFDELLAEVKAANPRQYEQFAPFLVSASEHAHIPTVLPRLTLKLFRADHDRAPAEKIIIHQSDGPTPQQFDFGIALENLTESTIVREIYNPSCDLQEAGTESNHKENHFQFKASRGDSMNGLG
jgi:hypothetical protein